MGEGQALIHGQYTNNVHYDIDALHEISKYWIAKHRTVNTLSVGDAV